MGFLNPSIYKADKSDPGAILDIKTGENPNQNAVIRVDYANTVDASDGYNVSVRSIDYEGPETYCDADNNCATRPVTLNVLRGYDEMTGIGVPGASFIADLSKF